MLFRSVLYQIGVQAVAEYRFTPSTWVNGALNLRMVDNFDKFTYTAGSNLPRVRTLQREYVTARRLTMPVLQLTHVGRLSDNQYYSVYGGALETMASTATRPKPSQREGTMTASHDR